MLVGGYVGDIGGADKDQSVIDIIDVEDASFSCSRTRNFNPIVSNENMIGAGLDHVKSIKNSLNRKSQRNFYTRWKEHF